MGMSDGYRRVDNAGNFSSEEHLKAYNLRFSVIKTYIVSSLYIHSEGSVTEMRQKI